jgi:hypothetical protein
VKASTLVLSTLLIAPALGSCSSSSGLSAHQRDAGGGPKRQDGGGNAAAVDARIEPETGGRKVDAAAEDASEGGGSRGPKLPLAGLLDMQDIAWHNTAGGEPTFTIANVDRFPGVFGGIVINATWDALQPNEDGPLDESTVETALAQVRDYNASNPSAPLGVKLRVYAGANAPAWAKEIDGGPVSIQRNPKGCSSGNCPLTIGKYWTAEYVAAWRRFQSALAGRYDPDPLVRHVAITSCAEQTDEPFVPTIDPSSQANLAAAGVTDALRMDCLSNAIDDYAAWKSTLIDFTFNTFTPTTGPADASFSVSVMQRCQALGEHCVLDNHALSVPLRGADQPIYDAMGAASGPKNFQTEAPAGMGCDWTQTIAQGVALGAVGIEVWPNTKYQGFDGFTMEQMKHLAGEFTSPVPVGSPAPQPTPCMGFH